MTSMPMAHFFAFGRISDSFKGWSDVFLGSRSVCSPISGNFSARGAPRFWKFCNDFARVLRKICVTSARHAGVFACTTHFRLGDEIQRCSEVCATHVLNPSARRFCARGAPKFRKFCKFFARFRREVCVISTPDARLFGGQRTHDFFEN